MSDAVTAATVNPAQDGPAVPNADRPKADDTTKTPEQIAAEAAAAETPPADDPPASAPQIGEGEDERPAGPTSADADADGVITYEPTGDAGLDVALTFVGKLGIGMDDPAMQATADGDFSLIKAKLATMGDKATGWEQMVALAEQAHERHVTTTTERNADIGKAVSGVLGDSQKDILAWASKNATDAERAEINTMLRASPTQARAAATILLDAYRAAGGTVVKPASATNVNAGNGGDPKQSQTGPLTNRQFATESAKLHRQYGNAYTNTPEYAALSARLG